ncbi:hypothetical protein RJ640_016530 [Escallonia rubra]|uniref:Alpha/beta hydrolase fold-3 domain-containing protein n=1 Tax=Escallonia rubra TaxID=112253 RepID=A0AA88SIA3_9ASTE|nr:hypothetical protein RJ640_016530 [Escallonia rubra]
MVVRADGDGDGLKKISGMVLIHPYFGNEEPDKLWEFICSDSGGVNDPRLNPAAHSGLVSKLGCEKVLICTAGKDFLRDRGWSYYAALKESGWGGAVEILETEGEGHVFHLFNPTSDKAKAMMKLIASFINPTNAASFDCGGDEVVVVGGGGGAALVADDRWWYNHGCGWGVVVQPWVDLI